MKSRCGRSSGPTMSSRTRCHCHERSDFLRTVHNENSLRMQFRSKAGTYFSLPSTKLDTNNSGSLAFIAIATRRHAFACPFIFRRAALQEECRPAQFHQCDDASLLSNYLNSSTVTSIKKFLIGSPSSSRDGSQLMALSLSIHGWNGLFKRDED